LSERQNIGRWIPALATLVLLLFSAGANTGISEPLERPLHLANGFGAPEPTNEAGNIAATAGRALSVTKPTKAPGSKKSVGVLDGYQVQKTVLLVARSRQITQTPSHEARVDRIATVRGPPSVAFAI
jgi:hypothetical protein